MKRTKLPSASETLPGRVTPLSTEKYHFVNGNALQGPYPERMKLAYFGMGCFWGAERQFWQIEQGIHVTAVGYCGGMTPNPTYDEVCSGQTGHNEVVMVVFDPHVIPYKTLLVKFWENHDPTQGMRQGNDVGTQYRSGIYVTSDEQEREALAARTLYEQVLGARGFSRITTEILPAGLFYFAEGYHQQYLAKNPRGYCGLGGTGISCPVGLELS